MRKRGHIISSDKRKFQAEEMKIKEDLSINGYTKYAWDKGEFREKKGGKEGEGQGNGDGQARQEVEMRPKATVTIPYHEAITSRLRRAMKKAGVKAVPRNGKKIGESLVRIKDKLPKMKTSGVVYHVPCAGGQDQPCGENYIGETERPMEVRFREHHGNAKLPNGQVFASAIRQHAHETGHTFREEDVTFLDKGGSKPELRVREACQIRTLEPSLNGG